MNLYKITYASGNDTGVVYCAAHTADDALTAFGVRYKHSQPLYLSSVMLVVCECEERITVRHTDSNGFDCRRCGKFINTV